MQVEGFRSLLVYGPEDIPRWNLLEDRLVILLDRLSVFLGVKFPVISTYRSAEENERVGGVAGSQHLTGKAVDVVVPDSVDVDRFVSSAEEVGFSGIGVMVNDAGAVSAHLDTRESDHVATWGRIGSVGAPYVLLETALEWIRQLKPLEVVEAVGLPILGLTVIALLLIFGSKS